MMTMTKIYTYRGLIIEQPSLRHNTCIGLIYEELADFISILTKHLKNHDITSHKNFFCSFYCLCLPFVFFSVTCSNPCDDLYRNLN